MRVQDMSMPTIAATLLIALAGCQPHDQTAADQVKTVNAQAITLSLTEIPVSDSSPGAVISEQQVQVASRLMGYIRDIPVHEGDAVKAGQLLFSIDPTDIRGQVDQARAEKELRSNGPAIQPGLPVEITKIKFNDHEIVFEINNGGKSHKKWYQHIQIGMGGTMQPLDTQQQQQNPIAFGSYVTLRFKDEKVPDLNVDQAKKLLSVALDFHRKLPTELYSPKVPEKFKEAIRKHEVLVGMDKDAVLSAKGTPFRKVRETKPNGEETEDWLYGLPPHVLFVTFSGDTVVKIHQY